MRESRHLIVSQIFPKETGHPADLAGQVLLKVKAPLVQRLVLLLAVFLRIHLHFSSPRKTRTADSGGGAASRLPTRWPSTGRKSLANWEHG